MDTYYVYILECAEGSYYTGITNNLRRRLHEHVEGGNPFAYTYSRRPVILRWWEQFMDPTQAILFEKKIKGWTRRKKKALIDKDWEKLEQYSRNYTQFRGPR